MAIETSISKRVISLIIAVTFAISPIYAWSEPPEPSRENLSTPLVSDTDTDPDRRLPILNEWAGRDEPGAIGNGQPLIDLAGGKLPTELKLSRKRLNKIRDKVDEAILLALRLARSVRGAIDAGYPEYSERFAVALDSLALLRQDFSTTAHLFSAVVDSPEDYLLGFNYQGKINLSVELIEFLTVPRLAQYIFHECIPEKGGVTSREDHRDIYDKIQPVVFEEPEVLALKEDFRQFIQTNSGSSPSACLYDIEIYLRSDPTKIFDAQDLRARGLRKDAGGKTFLSVNAVQRELRQLASAGVLEKVPDGRRVRYALRSEIKNLSPPALRLVIKSIREMPELCRSKTDESVLITKVHGRVDVIVKKAAPTAPAAPQTAPSPQTAPAPEAATYVGELAPNLSSNGDINYWDDEIAKAAQADPDKTTIKILLERGENPLKVLSLDIPSTLMDPANRGLLIRYITASLYDNGVCEGVKQAVFFLEDKALEKEVVRLVKEEVAGRYKRMKVYANFGDEIEITDSGNFKLSVSKELRPRLAMSPKNLEGRCSIGVDVGGTGIKVTVMVGSKIVNNPEADYLKLTQDDIAAGGERLKQRVMERIAHAKEWVGKNLKMKVEAVGVTFPSAIKINPDDTFRVVRLTNFERFWSAARNGSTDFDADYAALNTIADDIKTQYGIGSVSVLNDADAFGFAEIFDRLRRGVPIEKIGTKVILPIGTGPGYVKIKDGYIENIPNQGGHMVLDLSDNALTEDGCGVQGCYGAYVPANAFSKVLDHLGIVIQTGTQTPKLLQNMADVRNFIAGKIAAEAVKLYKITGASDIVLAGGVSQGVTGKELAEAANRILVEKYRDYAGKVSVSVTDFAPEYMQHGGAVGAAVYAMSKLDSAKLPDGSGWNTKHNLPATDVGRGNVEEFFKKYTPRSEEKPCLVISRELARFIKSKGYPWFKALESRKAILYLEDYEKADDLKSAIGGKYNVVVGIGAGTATDWAKYAGRALNLETVIIPSALTANGMFTEKAIFYEGAEGKRERVSKESGPPQSVIIDLEFLRDLLELRPNSTISGERANRAGSGDLVSIIPALLDWRIAEREGRERIDGVIYDAAEQIVKTLDETAAEISDNTDLGMTVLSELMAEASLLNMRYGVSRPKDGSEHILGDEIDKRLPQGMPRLHCDLVAVSSVMMAYLQSIELDRYDKKVYFRVRRLVEKLGLPSKPEYIGANKEIIIEALLASQPRKDKYSYFDKHHVVDENGKVIDQQRYNEEKRRYEEAYELVFGSRTGDLKEFDTEVSHYVISAVGAMCDHINTNVVPNLDAAKTKTLIDLLRDVHKRKGTIVINSAGRVGDCAQFNADKLTSMGFRVKVLGRPRPEYIFNDGDLVMNISGSGSTSSVVGNMDSACTAIDIARRAGRRIDSVVITATPDSPTWQRAKEQGQPIIFISGRSKDMAGQSHRDHGAEYLPLSSTFEYSTALYLQGMLEVLAQHAVLSEVRDIETGEVLKHEVSDIVEPDMANAIETVREVMTDIPARIEKDLSERMEDNEHLTAEFMEKLLGTLEGDGKGGFVWEYSSDGKKVYKPKGIVRMFGLGQNEFILGIFARRLFNMGIGVQVPGPRPFTDLQIDHDVAVGLSGSGISSELRDMLLVALGRKEGTNYPPIPVTLVTANPNTLLAVEPGITAIPIAKESTDAASATILNDSNPSYKRLRRIKELFEFGAMFYFEGICVTIMKMLDIKEEELRHAPKGHELSGDFAPPSNPVIQDLIRNDSLVEVWREEDGSLKAQMINYVDGYEAGVTGAEIYGGDMIDVDRIMDSEAQKMLAQWLADHPSNKGPPVRFRVALGNLALGWTGDVNYSNIAHASPDSDIIYTGQYLLQYLLRPQNEDLRKAIWDHHEYRRLIDESYNPLKTDLGYQALLKRAEQAIKEINKEQIASSQPVNAQVFKANLMKILADNPDELTFIGVETRPEDQQQTRSMMPLYQAVDDIAAMEKPNGQKMFPNLKIVRGTADSLVATVKDLCDRGDAESGKKLKLERTFIGARQSSVQGLRYEDIQGLGKAWISALDDSNPGSYLPVFESIILNMMACNQADITVMKSLYDAISDKPVTPEALQDMIRNRLVVILPKITAFDANELHELYEAARQAYASA